MIEHSTYGGQFEGSEVPEVIEERLADVISVEDVAFEPGPDDGAELVVKSKFSRLEKRTVWEVIRDAVGVDQVVLNLRVSFSEVRHEVCVQV